MSATGPFTATLTGLSSNTLYYYRSYVDGGTVGIAIGEGGSFATTAEAPLAQTLAAMQITSNAARLNGNLTSLSSASSVDVFLAGEQPPAT